MLVPLAYLYDNIVTSIAVCVTVVSVKKGDKGDKCLDSWLWQGLWKMVLFNPHLCEDRVVKCKNLSDCMNCEDMIQQN